MKDALYVGDCPVCHQGRQLVRIELQSGRYFLKCEECESEWANIEDASDPLKATIGAFGKSALAVREEMQDHPWASRIQNMAVI